MLQKLLRVSYKKKAGDCLGVRILFNAPSYYKVLKLSYCWESRFEYYIL